MGTCFIDLLTKYNLKITNIELGFSDDVSKT